MTSNFQLLIQLLITFQPHSIQENNGQTANLSKKLEINLIVVHAGHSELLKPCQIEFALPLTKLDKIEFLLNTQLHAALFAVKDAMEVTQDKLGANTKHTDLFLETYITTTFGANHTPQLHVITTLLENMDLAQLQLQLQLARKNAHQRLIQNPSMTIDTMPQKLTAFHQMLLPSKLKS